jgi:hypothetical protein
MWDGSKFTDQHQWVALNDGRKRLSPVTPVANTQPVSSNDDKDNKSKDNNGKRSGEK